MDVNFKDLPRLIIAITSNREYVHIRDADKRHTYFCPCCGSEVKPRSINGKVQAHYYHLDANNCNGETIAHWLYKNWLFEPGNKFLVDNKNYSIASIDIEKCFATPFGDYIPDLYIECNEGKSFFFEIAYSNKKNRQYADIWGFLSIDVVEVDIKSLIDADYTSSIPKFATIFSNGAYLKNYKSQSKRDKYLTYREEFLKLEKSTSKQIEQMDDLWQLTKSYVSNQISEEDVLLKLDTVPYEDAVFASRMFKRLKCIDLFEVAAQSLRDRICGIIRSKYLEHNDKTDFEIKCEQLSKYIWDIGVCTSFSYKDRFYELNYWEREKTYDGILDPLLHHSMYGHICSIMAKKSKFEKALKMLNSNAIKYGLKYYISSKYPYWVDIEFWGNPFNALLKSKIGSLNKPLCECQFSDIDSSYKSFIEHERERLISMGSKHCFFNSSDCLNALAEIQKTCDEQNLILEIVGSEVVIMDESFLVTQFYVHLQKSFDLEAKQLHSYISNKILDYLQYKKEIYQINSMINSCKNKFWESIVTTNYYGYSIAFKSKDGYWGQAVDFQFRQFINDGQEIGRMKKSISSAINDLMDTGGYYWTEKRLVEVLFEE